MSDSGTRQGAYVGLSGWMIFLLLEWVCVRLGDHDALRLVWSRMLINQL